MIQVQPIVKHVVLIGGGHTHALVIRMWAMKPIPGVRLTLISPSWQTPYSGMLPGLLAGHYTYDDVHIDLRKLCTWANIRFIEDRVVALERNHKILTLKHHPDMTYDTVSIDIGASPNLKRPGFKAFAHPVKPINQFYPNYLACIERCRLHKPSSKSPFRIAVVGGGAGGIEVVLAMANALSDIQHLNITLILKKEALLTTYPHKIAQAVSTALNEMGVIIESNFNVIKVEKNSLISDQNQKVCADEIFFCTQVVASEWPKKAGLECDTNGFITVNKQLKSINDDNIFAVGDIANMATTPRAKAGVYAVRQAPVLLENIKRHLLKKALIPYVPQDGFLSLISLGQKKAIAAKNSFTVTKRSFQTMLWCIKDAIDQRFMSKFDDLPLLSMHSHQEIDLRLIDQTQQNEIKNHAIRCAGCGSKVGSSVLRNVINHLLGEDHFMPEDAVIIKTPHSSLLQTVDQITSPIDDPYLFGKIATLHALSDIFAMNATPKSVQILLNLPFAAIGIQTQEMTLVMQGVLEVLNAHNCHLSGGHTAEAKELSLGLVVNALPRQNKSLFHKNRLKSGDILVLSKPIGTGVILAAQMQNVGSKDWCYKGSWHSAAINSMLLSNQQASHIFSELEIEACTDVTGFGLLGHLAEMLEASRCKADIKLEQIPLLAGARELSEQNIRSSLYPHNLEISNKLSISAEIINHPTYPLLFDPQTSGGLLAGVSPEKFLALKQRTDMEFYVIGSVTSDKTEWDISIQ